MLTFIVLPLPTEAAPWYFLLDRSRRSSSMKSVDCKLRSCLSTDIAKNLNSNFVELLGVDEDIDPVVMLCVNK